MDILRFKCPVCYTAQTEEVDGEFSISEINKDKECIRCGKTLKVDEHFVNDNNEIEVEISYEWTDENEAWNDIEVHEDITRIEEQYEILDEDYNQLSSNEKENYNVCDIRGEIYMKHTGLCRIDPYSDIRICKHCKHLETLGY
ncbi:hypothetical protein ACQKJC_21770 [Priestia koreensis]|uniref:hypothetical protein n=1 Tax=Priestia koreensis TaxID=284581 RepID=UPI003D06A52C